MGFVSCEVSNQGGRGDDIHSNRELSSDSRGSVFEPFLICVFLSKRHFEPSHEKTNNLGFRPGLTQINLYSHRSRLEACDFRFKKNPCSENKVLISCEVTAQLISTFVFVYAECWFSHAATHLLYQ